MRKILTIIFIIISVVLVILLVTWGLSRKKAQNAGMRPLSFREFLSTGVDTTATPNPDGGLSSEFTDTPPTDIPPASVPQREPQLPQVSQFTPGVSTPNTTGSTTGGQQSQGSGVSTSTTTGGFSGSGATSSAITPPPITTATQGVRCSDADLNITFTPAQLARLRVLQDEFYVIAQTLRDDANVQTQYANYTAFKAKERELQDLVNFCKQAVNAMPNGASNTQAWFFKNRVPTPFWYEQADIRPNPFVNPSSIFGVVVTNQALTNIYNIPLGYIMGPGQVGGQITRTIDKSVGKRSLEALLRLNLW